MVLPQVREKKVRNKVLVNCCPQEFGALSEAELKGDHHDNMGNEDEEVGKG
jgi:hypothetical protein